MDAVYKSNKWQKVVRTKFKNISNSIANKLILIYNNFKFKSKNSMLGNVVK